MTLNLQLINFPENKLVWAERFSGPLDQIFNIQEEIVEKIVSSVQIYIDNDVLSRVPAQAIKKVKCLRMLVERNGRTQKGIP